MVSIFEEIILVEFIGWPKIYFSQFFKKCCNFKINIIKISFQLDIELFRKTIESIKYVYRYYSTCITALSDITPQYSEPLHLALNYPSLSLYFIILFSSRYWCLKNFNPTNLEIYLTHLLHWSSFVEPSFQDMRQFHAIHRKSIKK